MNNKPIKQTYETCLGKKYFILFLNTLHISNKIFKTILVLEFALSVHSI